MGDARKKKWRDCACSCGGEISYPQTGARARARHVAILILTTMGVVPARSQPGLCHTSTEAMPTKGLPLD